MKLIRWKGLIAFAAVTGLILGTWLLLVDSAVKNMIEAGGTKAVGARVDLMKADLSLSPLGLTLDNLDITDPDAPMTNMVHVDRIAFLLDFRNLLLGKVIVNEMALQGVKTGTPRKTSGEIKKSSAKAKGTGPERAKEKEGDAGSFSIKTPSPEEILKKEKLLTLQRIEETESFLDAKDKEWKEKASSLPDDQKIKDYDNRIKTIKKELKGKSKEVVAALKDADKLKKEIDKELKKIREAADAMKSDLKTLEQKVKGLDKLPARDLKNLKDKYALTPEGLSNFSKLLFDEKISRYLDDALRWYDKAKPYLERAAAKDPSEKEKVRAKGREVLFREYNPRPDLLVKKALLTVEIPAGDIKGQVTDITDNQAITGKPTRFDISGAGLKGIESVTLSGEVNRMDAGKPLEKANIKIKSLVVKDAVLSKNPGFPVTLASALADIDINVKHSNGIFDADFKAEYEKALISAKLKEDASALSKALAEALSGISKFNIKGKVYGKKDDLNVKISSNLDSAMEKAVGDIVKRESEKFAKNLDSAIKEKVKGPLAQLEEKAARFKKIEEDFRKKIKELEEKLKSSSKLEPKGLKLPF